MESIKELKLLYSKFLKLSKQIIDKQSLAFIPLQIDGGLEPSHDDKTHLIHDYFNAERWWQSLEDLKRGVLEYLKLFNFYFKKQFEL